LEQFQAQGMLRKPSGSPITSSHITCKQNKSNQITSLCLAA
jgi:hypothetical protein